MPLAEGEDVAGYTILRSLGHGGMGEVYLAQHPRLPRQDALKVLTAAVSADDEYRQRFQREADIAATLWHPHIVSVHDRGDFGGLLWISMDFVQGTDAARLLAEKYPNGMPPDVVVRIITAVASALDHAHERGLYHRDVKPANILIANPGKPDERAMLADFGIARHDGDASGLTGTNMTVGTVAYAAPEQLRGDRIDGRADQYALAATAYQLLTGTPPFTHTNPAVVISAHLTSEPPAIGAVRPELSSLGPVFGRALAKSPDKRFDRCIDFARALEHRIGADDASMETVSSAKAVPPAVGRHAKPVTPRRWPRLAAFAAAGVAVVGLAVGGVVWFGHRDHTSSADPALPVVVVGADCATMGAAGVTPTGSPAYCARLTDTNETIWSKYQGEFDSPSVPAGMNPDEANVRVCMEQTDKSEADCDADIDRHNATNG
ncbi:serine/threonine-protein kinase [Mycobacterium sp. GA-2829]|uniref:serine/threonine-protein kinase n=1 Tax=Mycobacterium sp. GA-2829 TaxID=1772283 RepID=UPI00074009DE|nr:serine/threonine-protein kinase [Mycobacterium sp. GA-2829]KUI37254.1 serine/threonine protein kinase [Mycobacterium sp. GA-2829]